MNVLIWFARYCCENAENVKYRSCKLVHTVYYSISIYIKIDVWMYVYKYI